MLVDGCWWLAVGNISNITLKHGVLGRVGHPRWALEGPKLGQEGPKMDPQGVKNRVYLIFGLFLL